MRIRDPADCFAWQEFDQRYRELLIRYFRRKQLSAADADDLAQQVFSRLITYLPRFTYDPNRGRFRDFLFRCARNARIEWANRRKRDGKALFMDVALNIGDDGEPDPAEAQVWEEEWVNHHYGRALETLKTMAAARDIAILERSIAGATVEELAGEFAMEQPAVLKARQRIREKVELLISAQVAEEDRIDG